MSTEVKKFCPDCLNDTFEFVHHPDMKDINDYELRCAKCHRHIIMENFDCGFGVDQWSYEDENGNIITDYFER